MDQFKKLSVWQKSMDLVTNVYECTKEFPDTEKFRLLTQICGAAVSIPSNIAEGAGRNSNKEFNLFLGYSLGSAFELDTQLTVAKNLGYINKSQYEQIEKELYYVQGMLIKLKKSLN